MKEPNKLHILWTNDNITTAEKMVFMYAIAAKENKWWDEVTLILWGATVKLTAENKQIQALIAEAQAEGIHVSACQSCADQLGVTDILETLGIAVIYWGEPLTKILKTDQKLLTI